MQSILKQGGRAELAILAILAVAFVLLFFAGPAFAGADTTFNTALTKFTNFLEGSGGKIITVLSLAGGIVALSFFATSKRGYVYKFVCKVVGDDAAQVFVSNPAIAKEGEGTRSASRSTTNRKSSADTVCAQESS